MENPRLPPPGIPKIEVACAGEALIDMVMQRDASATPLAQSGLHATSSPEAPSFKACVGGAVFNFSRALARLGVGVAYLNPLSEDHFGCLLRETLQNDGVQLAEIQPSPAATALAIVHTSADGQPGYRFYRQGVADRMVSHAGLTQHCASLPQLRLVYTGCLALAAEDSHAYLPWLAEQKQAGHLIAIDANLRPQVMPDLASYRQNVLQALALADIVKISDEDLHHLGLLERSSQTSTNTNANMNTDADNSAAISAAVGLHANLAAQNLLLTLGAAGSVLLQRDQKPLRAKESAALTIGDTVGAGDCYFAAFVATYLEDPANTHSALQRAIAAASINIQRSGCNPATREEIDAHIRTHPPLVT